MREIASTLPVIGPLLLRKQAKRLVGSLQAGCVSSVPALAEIAATSPDPAARRIARQGVSSLSSRDAIEALCIEALLQDTTVIRDFVLDHGYSPRDPGAKALFLYMTGQFEAFHQFDKDVHYPLLTKGYTAATIRLRSRALDYAKKDCQSGEGITLARAIIGADLLNNAPAWTYSEWDLITAALMEERSWDMLWSLVGFAPPAHSLAALHGMHRAGWRPRGDEQQIFDELVCDLPEQWKSPIPETPSLTREIRDSRVLRLCFSRDGTLLAAGSCDGTVVVWQVASSRLRFSCKTGAGALRFLAFSTDNALLVIGGDRGSLHAFSLSGDHIWDYVDQEHQITSAIISGNGEEIIAGDEAGNLLRISCRAGAVCLTRPCHTETITALAEDTDGRTIVTGHADGTLCCLDAMTGEERWLTAGYGDSIREITFNRKTREVVVIRSHSLPFSLSLENGKILKTYSGHAGKVSCNALSHDGDTIVAGGDPNVLCIWHKDESPAKVIPFYGRGLSCCSITPDGTCLAVCCTNGTLSYLDLPGGAKKKEIRASRRPASTCTISPDGKLLAAAGWDGTVTFRSVPDGELIRTLRRPAGSITSLGFAGGAGGLFAGMSDGTVRIFSHGSDTAGQSIDCYTPAVLAVAASSDGKILACSGKDQTLRFWDPASESLLATCNGIKNSQRCLAFLPGRGPCISGGWDGMIRIWDAASGTILKARKGHTSFVTCCAVSPSGMVFVTGSNDTTACIWDAAMEREPVVLRDAGKEVRCCAISPDGTLLATASQEPVIRLYHLPDGAGAGTIPQIPGVPSSISFTSDGLLLATGSTDGTLVFYAVHDRCLVRTLHAHAGAVTGIVALPGENSIVTSGEDGRIHTFRIPYRNPLSIATYDDIGLAQELSGLSSAMAAQWRFLSRLLAVRFQNEIQLCPVFNGAGVYDIQICGGS